MKHAKNIITAELLFIFVFASLLIVDSTDKLGMTGSAVQGVTQDSILGELKTALPKIDFIKDITDSTLCIIVNINQNTRYSYDVVKAGNAIDITNSQDLYCRGLNNEDFIISYVSYEKLKEQLTYIPTFKEFKRTSDGTNFYILPSKQINEGMILASPAEFGEKYRDFLNANFDPAEIRQILNPGLAQLEQASPFVSYMMYFVAAGVIVILLITFVMIKFTKKPEIGEDLELVSYIKSSFSQGYEEAQIKDALVKQGWSEEKIQKAMQSATSEVTPPPDFNA